jgi:hypothetical protein
MSATAATFPAVVKPHPFASDTSVAYVREGQTLREMIGSDATDSLRIEVGGVEVPAHMWGSVRPRAGTPVHITAIPQGGNGGKWLRTILLIVVAIVAWEVAPYLTGEFGVFAGANTAMVAAGLALVGQLAITPLIPPPEMKP